MPEEVEASSADMIVELGRSLLSSGYNVIDTRASLEAVAQARGIEDAEVGVFPTLIVFSAAENPVARALPVSPNSLRYDQVMLVHGITRAALDPTQPASEVLSALRHATRRRPRPPIADVGYIAAAGGFSILLGGGFVSLLLTFVLAALVLLVLRLLNGQRQRALATLLGAFIASILATWISSWLSIGVSPLLVSLSAIALLIPSGSVVTATEELAAGEMVSGASRLLYSLLQIVLLAVAIFAGAGLVGGGAVTYTDPAGAPFGLLTVAGLILFTVGVALYTGTPRNAALVMLAVVAITYGVQQVASWLTTTVLSVGIAACIGLSVALLIQRLDILGGPPGLVTFTPAFWVLIPGALALGGIVVALAGDGLTLTGQSFGLSVAAIVIGCLLGSIVGSSVKQRQRASAA